MIHFLVSVGFWEFAYRLQVVWAHLKMWGQRSLLNRKQLLFSPATALPLSCSYSPKNSKIALCEIHDQIRHFVLVIIFTSNCPCITLFAPLQIYVLFSDPNIEQFMSIIYFLLKVATLVIVFLMVSTLLSNKS